MGTSSASVHWSTPFLQSSSTPSPGAKTALIILNQPFSRPLLDRLWNATSWRACADGGANKLHDILVPSSDIDSFIPDLIKGDLDSLRDDVQRFYESKGVPVVQDRDEYSTDLMKCLASLEEIERSQGGQRYDVVLLGGLAGRLDQTMHTLSYLHKLRKSGRRIFAVTDNNIGWVLDTGEHTIAIDHSLLGPTCGLLPVGVDSTVLSTKGLRWNLDVQESGFDGLMSTSNHLVPGQDVWIRTSRPIWWTAELRSLDN